MKKGDILVAKTSAVFRDRKGNLVRLRKGRTTIEVGNDLLKGREQLFEPLKITYPVPVAAGRAKKGD
jgi:hypothetical protein